MAMIWASVALPSALPASSGQIEPAFVGQQQHQRADEAFRHRKGDVGAIGRIGAAGAFIHHAALVQHDDAIGEIGIKGLPPGQRPAIERRVGHGIKIDTQRARQRRHRPGAPDGGGGHQLVEMAEGPARAREAPHGGIIPAHLFVTRRRVALHQAQPGGIGFGRGGHGGGRLGIGAAGNACGKDRGCGHGNQAHRRPLPLLFLGCYGLGLGLAKGECA
jgi:hypothetical protein